MVLTPWTSYACDIIDKLQSRCTRNITVLYSHQRGQHSSAGRVPQGSLLASIHRHRGSLRRATYAPINERHVLLRRLFRVLPVTTTTRYPAGGHAQDQWTPTGDTPEGEQYPAYAHDEYGYPSAPTPQGGQEWVGDEEAGGSRSKARRRSKKRGRSGAGGGGGMAGDDDGFDEVLRLWICARGGDVLLWCSILFANDFFVLIQPLWGNKLARVCRECSAAPGF